MRKLSWGEYKKSFLDKIIERIRFSLISNRVLGRRILDLGCGYNAMFLSYIKERADKVVGIDLYVNKKISSKKMQLISSPVDKKINLISNSFDTIVSMAVIEHVDNPSIMLREAYRLLRKNGKLLLTTPSAFSKPLLELLAHKLHLISSEEISDHKRYYTPKTLKAQLIRVGFINVKVKTLLGLNIFAESYK